MQPAPDAGRVPVAQPTPAGHATAALHLLGQPFPGNAGAEHEDDPGQCIPVRDPGPAAVRVRRRRREQGLDHRPQLIGNDVLLVHHSRHDN